MRIRKNEENREKSGEDRYSIGHEYLIEREVMNL